MIWSLYDCHFCNDENTDNHYYIVDWGVLTMSSLVIDYVYTYYKDKVLVKGLVKMSCHGISKLFVEYEILKSHNFEAFLIRNKDQL